MEAPQKYPYSSLIDAIYLFSRANVEELPSNQAELERFLRQPVDSAKCRELHHQLRCLALQQMVDPLLESLGQGVSNAPDAQAVAENLEEPVHVTLEGRKLRIADQGIGIDYLRLRLPIVAGLTTNQQGIFGIEKGLANVSGRFGQGFLSLFYYLVYHWKEKPKPQVIKTNGSLEIHLPLIREQGIFKVIFKKSPGKPVEIVGPLLDPLFAEKRKITLWTRRGETSFKIRFKEDKGQFLWSVKPKAKPSRGTVLSVDSPLITRHAQTILSGLGKIFAFLHPTPLFIQGQRVNTFEGYIRHDFPICTVFYADKQSDAGNVLVICEKGRPVVTIPQPAGPLLPQAVVLSFKRLPLTHDRSSLDWKNPTLIDIFTTLIHEISKSNLALQLRLTLLNALAPILHDDRSGLNGVVIKFLYDQYQVNWSICLPDVPSVRRMGGKESYYVHSNYIETPRFSDRDSHQIPIGFWEEPGKEWLFLDRALFDGKPENVYLNTLLANAWYQSFIGEKGTRPTRSFPEPQWRKQALSDASTPQNPDLFTAAADKQTFDCRQVTAHLQEKYKISPRDQLKHCFYHFADHAFPLSLFNWLADFLLREKRQILVDCRNAGDVSFDLWVRHVPYFIHNFASLNNLGSAKTSTLQMAQEMQAAFEATMQLPTEKMRRCFIAYSSCNLMKRTFSQALVGDFLRYYQALEKGGCSDKDYLDSFFATTEDRLKAMNPEDLTSFLQKIPLPQKDYILPILKKINLEQVIHWSEEELISFIDAISLEKMKSDYLLPYYGTYRCCNLENTSSLEPLRPLLQKLPRSHHCLLKLLLSYYFNDKDAVGLKKWNFFSTVKLANWDAFFKFFIPLVLNKKGSEIEECSRLFGENLLRVSFLFELIMQYGGMTYELENEGDTEGDDFVNFEREKNFILEAYKTDKTEAFFGEVANHWDAWVTSLKRLLPLHQEFFKPSHQSLEARMNNISLVINEVEQLHPIHDEVRPWIYLFFLSDGEVEKGSLNFEYEQFEDAGHPLETDKRLIEHCGSVAIAAQQIQSATLQNTKDSFGPGEILKNAIEAGSPIVDVRTSHTVKEFVVEFEDQVGMTKKEQGAFITPGKTTKREEVKKPNYGRGVFAVFGERGYNSLTLKTRHKDATEGAALRLEVTDSGLTLKEKKVQKESPGSIITLARAHRFTPFLDMLLFRGELLQVCRYLSHVKVTFNGKEITKAGHSPDSSLATTFTDQQGDRQEVTAEAIQGKGLLFVLGHPTGELPVEYGQWVPPLLQKVLKKKGLEFSLFLNNADQVMGRSQQVADLSALNAIRPLLLRLSFLTVLNLWKSLFGLDLISRDFWDLRIQRIYPLTDPAKRLIAIYEDQRREVPLWLLQSNPERIEEQSALVMAVEKYLANVNPAELPNEGKDALLQGIKSQMVEKADLLEDENTVLTSLLYAPLPGTSFSMMELREKVVKHLQEAGIFEGNKYSSKWVLGARDNIKNGVAEVFKPLYAALAPGLHSLLTSLETKLVERLSVVLKQLESEKRNIPESPELREFLKALALRFYNRHIEVSFVVKTDGQMAEAIPESNSVFVNLAAKVEDFHELVKDYRDGLDREEWVRKHGAFIVEWVKALAHECTHLEEKKACNNTHDPAFDKKVALKIEPFLSTDGTPKIIEILEEIIYSATSASP